MMPVLKRPTFSGWHNVVNEELSNGWRQPAPPPLFFLRINAWNRPTGLSDVTSFIHLGGGEKAENERNLIRTVPMGKVKPGALRLQAAIH